MRLGLTYFTTATVVQIKRSFFIDWLRRECCACER